MAANLEYYGVKRTFTTADEIQTLGYAGDALPQFTDWPISTRSATPIIGSDLSDNNHAYTTWLTENESNYLSDIEALVVPAITLDQNYYPRLVRTDEISGYDVVPAMAAAHSKRDFRPYEMIYRNLAKLNK